METSNKLTGEQLSLWTSSAEDIPANLSVPQANDEAQTTLDICGHGYETPLAHYDPDTQSWKMYGDISLWGEQPSLENLPKSGMTQNGVLYQQPDWVRPINAIALLSWPTPTASDWKGRGPNSEQQGLPEVVKTRMGLWPTPRAAQAETRNHTVYERSMGKPQNLENRIASADPSTVGGKLNPTWVEWLMGFPLGWTDLEASETQ